MKRNSRLISLLLALFLLVGMLPATALADKSDATTFSAFMDEIACDQFVVRRDSNSYEHSFSDFPNAYQISEEYVNRLLSKCSFSEQMQVLTMLGMPFIGSCYGIAATMVLNRLTQSSPQDAENGGYALYIDQFQPGAQKYFDLTKPKDNPPVLDMINYYMCSQNMHVVKANTKNVILYGTAIQDATAKSAADVDLNEFIDTAKAFVDAGKPALFSFQYSAGGHAIVLCDYAENTVVSDGILFKLYDENDRSAEKATGYPRYSYLEIMKDGTEYKASKEFVKLFTFDYSGSADGKTKNYTHATSTKDMYAEHDLSSFSVTDMANVNKALNIHNDGAPAPVSTDPEFRFQNIQSTYGNYLLKPFIKTSGDVKTYADESGSFYYGANVAGVPIPVNDGSDPLNYYSNMKNFRYSARNELGDVNSRIVDLTVVHNTEGKFNGAPLPFHGYDVVTSCGKLADFIVSKDNADGSGAFSYVNGTSVGTVSFDAAARLSGLKSACTGGAGDVTLFCGSYGNGVDLDMFALYGMSDFKELTIDSSDPNSILLEFDQFPDQMGLQFYKGARISRENLLLRSDDRENDKWVKIKTEENPDTQEIEVSVWSGKDVGGQPQFSSDPDYTTKLQRRDYSTSAGSGGLNTVAGDYAQLGIIEGENGTWAGGDYTLRVNAPFSEYISTSVDNVPVPGDGLIVTEGSTIVTLKEAFLATLTPGVHVLRVQFKSGYAQTTFTVGGAKLSTAAVPALPATGAGGVPAMALLCLLSGLFVYALRKRRA